MNRKPDSLIYLARFIAACLTLLLRAARRIDTILRERVAEENR